MRARGVVFAEAPRRETYGTVAVFLDLYGNRFDLIEPAWSREERARMWRALVRRDEGRVVSASWCPSRPSPDGR